jgi:hypothetical protein
MRNIELYVNSCQVVVIQWLTKIFLRNVKRAVFKTCTTKKKNQYPTVIESRWKTMMFGLNRL